MKYKLEIEFNEDINCDCCPLQMWADYSDSVIVKENKLYGCFVTHLMSDECSNGKCPVWCPLIKVNK